MVLRSLKKEGSILNFESNSNQLKQLKKYADHKRFFDIEECIYLKPFEDLLKIPNPYNLTCTCKVEKTDVLPCRFFIDYSDKNIIHLLKIVFDFIKDFSQLENVNLNFDYIKKIFSKDMDAKEIKKVITGIDFRKNLMGSRIKLYLVLKGSNKILEGFSKLFGAMNAHIMNKKQDHIIGIDLFFNGTTKIKLYEIYDENDLQMDITKKTFENNYSRKICDMIENSRSLIICLEEAKLIDKTDTRLDFNIQNVDYFVNQINNKTFEETRNKIIAKSAGLYDIQQIALYKNELDENKIQNINIYY